MKKVVEFIKRNWVLISIVIVGAFLRFYKLDEIPGEMFGDINANYRDIRSVMEGEHAIFFPANTGREPLLFYITAVLAKMFGLTYLVQKITVALVGVVTIVTTYYFAKEFLDSKLAVFAALTVAVSKWHIIFSRIGFRAILAPLFVQLTFIFLLRAFKRMQMKDFLFAGVFLGVGMYTYTAFRIMPVLVLFLCLIYLLSFIKKKKKFLQGVVGLFAVFSAISAPIANYAIKNPEAYWGHVGKKIVASEIEGASTLDNLAKNIISQAGMLHVRGDIVFRVNPVHQPQVDVISAALFLAGAVYLIKKFDKKLIIFIGSSFLALQLPSVLSINYPIDVPSATRSTAAIPFILLIPSIGIYWVAKVLKKNRTLVTNGVITSIALGMLILNYNHVFSDYVEGLPNRNTPFGRVIAERIDQVSAETSVFVVSCCWGDWGQPEPDGIRFTMKKQRKVNFLAYDEKIGFRCTDKDMQSQFYITNPQEVELIGGIKECYLDGKEEIIRKNGFDVAWSYMVK